MQYRLSAALLDEHTTIAGQVGSNLFGAIANNYFGWERFLEQTKNLNLDTIRFPGGAVSENGWVHGGYIKLDEDLIHLDALEGDRSHVAFDLTHPELISPIALEYDDTGRSDHNHVASFSEVIAAAVERGSDVGLIIPVERYYRDPENENGLNFSNREIMERAISIAQNDMSLFLSRLKSGYFNNGVYPEKIIFEIGNEQYRNPIQYGVIASAFISLINEELSDSSIDYEIAIQALRGVADYREADRNNYFDDYVSDQSALNSVLAPLVDEFLDSDTSREHRLPLMNQTLITVLGDSIDHVDILRQHTLGFNYDVYGRQYHNFTDQEAIRKIWTSVFTERNGENHGVKFYASAWSTNSGNGNGGYGELAAASNILELFSHFTQVGIDRAAIWGFVGEYKFDTETRSTTITDVSTGITTPQLVTLQLMSDNIKGAKLLSSGIDHKLDINITNAKEPWLLELGIDLDGKHENFIMHAFETASEYHVFLSSGKLNGGGMKIAVPLGEAQVLPFFGVTNIGIVGENTFGEADVNRSIGSIKDGTAVATFDQSYEIALISLHRSDTSESYEEELLNLLTAVAFQDPQTIDDQQFSPYTDQFVFQVGTDANDELTSNVSKRTIFDLFTQMDSLDSIGARSGQLIFGLGGEDKLIGTEGNDWLAGGSGDDLLLGSGGWDRFVFSGGDDIIVDFQFGVDRVIIDEGLLFGGADTLLESVSFTNTSAVIVFDDNSTLEILGRWTLDDIAKSVDFA